MTTKAQGGIAAAIEELEAHRQQLLDDYGKVETALGVLRGLQAPRLPLTPPDAPPAAPSPSSPPVPASDDSTEAGGDVLPEKVRAALKGGWMKRVELMTKARISAYDIKRFVQRGLLIATGVTHGRRYALPGTAAKEAP